MKEVRRGKKPTICLNMIVKNEANVVHESLESVAPHIDYWVIVDTGSTDGTQDVIRAKMAELDIPGELHDRPWQDFGHNRTQALQLAQGHCDYIWVHDADDVLDGTPNLTGLTADGYLMLEDSDTYEFRALHLFRDGVPWRFVGTTHEVAVCEVPHTTDKLDGQYRIRYRQTGSNSLGSNKLVRDRDLLIDEIERDPSNSRAVFYLALTYRAIGEAEKARALFTKRTQMGGFDEEIYYSLLAVAQLMNQQGEPWPAVQTAFLAAWGFRPFRSEALYEIALHHRLAEQYELGYLFASHGAQIPLPDSEVLFVFSDVYTWRLLDELSVCASWTGRKAEALTIDRSLLIRDDLPVGERERILRNRDDGADHLLEACSSYPVDAVKRPASRADAEVTITLTTGPDRPTTERTLNSFLHCCTDSTRVGRFLVIDGGLNAVDQKVLADHYPFLDFISVADADLNVVREQIPGRYWLHLWHGWRFFTEEALITRMIDVLETESEVYQVGINLGDALRLSPASPARSGVRTTPRGNRYLLSSTQTAGPAMFDMTRLHQVLAADGSLKGITATLDEVLCIHDS